MVIPISKLFIRNNEDNVKNSPIAVDTLGLVRKINLLSILMMFRDIDTKVMILIPE